VDKDSKPPGENFQKLFGNLKEAIWNRRPVLKDIISKHGDKTLFRYSQDFMDVNKSPRLDARKHELIGVAEELISKRLGQSVASEVAAQLKKLPLVSTADHHAPIDHPFFVNANIISALPYFDYPDPDIRYLVVFSFSSVSVNNPSAYPRGIEFHGGMNGSGNFIRLPILPDKLKMGVVYGTRAFTREDLTKAEQELVKKEASNEIGEGFGNKIRNLMETNFGAADVLAANDLASQITKINFHFWPKLFHGGARKMPDLIYLEIETLVTELLLRYHLHNKESLIHRLLFDPKYRALALEHFNNLAGGFSRENKWGTFLFWAVDKKLHRVRLELNTTQLFSMKRSFVFEMDPEALESALRSKQIFPSMLLCYLIVSFYYGMKCLGGFCQVHDLTMAKEAWSCLLRAQGEYEESDALIPIQTKELGGDGLTLAYLKISKGELVPATGIDMALQGGNTSFEFFVELSKKVTLNEMMNSMLPEIYTVLYSFSQRDHRLLALSPEQILRETGLQEKLSEAAVAERW
jgi:hypothetical protein